MESPVLGDGYAGFGERHGETDRWQHRHRAPCRLNRPPRLPLGRIRLHWKPASRAGWDVTAHLGLATPEVLLASWPAAPADWPRLVHPTLHEVTGLCAALAVATVALDLSNRLAEV
ncbi:hypothetical protein ACWC9Q_32165 [Streptomyces sp. NPDC001142]